MKKLKKIINGSELGISTQEFNVTAFQRTTTDYNIFLQGVINTEEDFQEAITVLSIAEEGDNVTIYLSSPGGSMDAGNTLIYAMSRCKAPVHVVGSGTIASMASFILLSADSYELDPFTSLMFHSASFGDCGDVVDVVEYSKFIEKQTRKIFEFHTEGFFTPAEIDSILINKKVYWMDCEEFCERFSRREALHEATYKDGLEEHIQALKEQQEREEEFEEDFEENFEEAF